MPTKSLNALALPLVISFTLRFMFSLVDMIFLGLIQKEHPMGVAAIGLFIPVQTVFIGLWVGLSGGFTATFSQALGRHDEARVTGLKRAMMKLHIGLVPVIWAFGAAIYFGTPLLKLNNPELEKDFLTYTLILVLSMPLSGFLSIYPDSIVKAHHDTVSTMKAGLWSTGANLVLNSLFVFVFHWGIAGIAVATVLSRYASLTYAGLRVRALERARRVEGWDQGASEWPREPLQDILTLAVPGGLTYALLLCEEVVIAKLLTAADGAAAYLASYAVYYRLSQLALMPVVATGVAVLPFVGRMMGADRGDEVRQNLRQALLMSTGLAMAIAVPVAWLFPDQVISLLISDEVQLETGENLGIYLSLVPIAVLCGIPSVLLRPVFEGVSRPGLGIRVSVIKSVVLAMPLALAGYFAAPWLGLDRLVGILLGLILGQAGASTIMALLCRQVLREAESKPRPAG